MSSPGKAWKKWIFVLVLLLLLGMLLLRWLKEPLPDSVLQEQTAEEKAEEIHPENSVLQTRPALVPEPEAEVDDLTVNTENRESESPNPTTPLPADVQTVNSSEQPERKAVYTEQTYQLVTDLVYTRRHQGSQGESKIQGLLAELKTADPALGTLWEGIMDYWKYAGEELTINRDILPDGLPEDNSLCIAVLGFQLLYDGEMAPELEGRCKTALASAKKYPNAYLLVTGGGTAYGNRSATEADVMAKWLEEHGIAPERILIENRSLTTDQNASFSCGIMTRSYPEIHSLAIVSSDYHIALGSMLFTEASLIYAYEHNCEMPYHVISNAGFRTAGNETYSNPAYFGSDIWVMANPTY